MGYGELSESIRKPPHTNARHHFESAVVFVESPPSCVIDHIEINETAQDVLSANLHGVATTDWVRQNIQMSVEMQGDETRALLVPRHSNRSVPLYYGDLYYHHQLGGMITGKGSFISGGQTHAHPGQILGRHTTAGLFEEGGAKIEFEYANDLLASGFRSAYPFAYAVFNAEKLKDWLYEKNRLYFGRVVNESFANMRSDSDVPAYLLRIQDTGERQYPFHSYDFSPTRSAVDIARGARILQKEYNTDPSSRMRWYGMLLGEHEPAMLEALDLLQSRRRLQTNEQVRAYKELICTIYAVNAVALSEVNEQRIARGADTYIHPRYISQEKDVGFAFSTCDYEDARSKAPIPGNATILAYIADTAQAVSTMLKRYRSVLVEPFVVDDHAFSSDSVYVGMITRLGYMKGLGVLKQ